jgi:tripeptidyl-peptidase I
MEAEPNAPWVHSVSYGDKESTISSDYAQRCETEFQKFGSTGRTIFFASGDDGVGCKQTSCTGGSTPTLNPNWPASSPSVTAVVSYTPTITYA